MKFGGKVIAGSNLLTILGVVCFATMIVSAVLITSTTLNFTGTPVSVPGSIALTAETTPGATLAGNSAVYVFNANVGQALTSGVQVKVDIAKAGISTSDVTSATIAYDGDSTPDALSLSDAGETLTATWLKGSAQIVDADIPCIITIVYATAGTYVVSATMSGTA